MTKQSFWALFTYLLVTPTAKADLPFPCPSCTKGYVNEALLSNLENRKHERSPFKRQKSQNDPNADKNSHAPRRDLILNSSQALHRPMTGSLGHGVANMNEQWKRSRSPLGRTPPA